LQTRVFEQEREDHVFDLTIESVSSHGSLRVKKALQVDGSRNEENTCGGPILEVGDGTE
jgi:hypothetical protein